MMISLGLLSYGLAATGFLLLTLLLLTSWEGRALGVRLVIACAVTTLWAALLALGSQVVIVSVPLVLLAEFLRYGAWFIVLTGLTKSAGIASGLSRIVHVVWIGSALLLFATPMLVAAGLPAPHPTAVLANGGLLMALMGLVLLEQIYRNAREGGRYALKFFVIAVGLMLAYDLFLYSQAQLLKGIEPASWDARGFVVMLMVPLLAIAARRNPQWSLNVFVSRHVVFYTTSFMVVGAYLLLMAGGGYLIRIYGGTWGRPAQLVFFAGAGVVLMALLASSNLRRRLRVFLNKHFYRNKYDYRIEWLRFIQTLSRPEEGIETRDNAVRAIAQIIGSPGGVLFLRSEEGTEFRPVASWPSQDFDTRAHSPLLPTDEMVAFLSQHQWVIDLAELRETPDAYQNILLPDTIARPAADAARRATDAWRGADWIRGAGGPAAAVQAQLRGPRPAEDRRASRGGAPRAVRGGSAPVGEPAVRGVPPAHCVRDARPQEPDGAARADRLECREAQAQPRVRGRRDRHDRELDGADAAADRAAAASGGAEPRASRVACGDCADGCEPLRGACARAGVPRDGRRRLGRGRSGAADDGRRAHHPQCAGRVERVGRGERGRDGGRRGAVTTKSCPSATPTGCACRWRR